MRLAKLSPADRQRVVDLSLREAAKALAERQPQPKLARPSPNPLAAALIDACIALEGADIVQSYLQQLKQANKVSLARFEQAARWAKRQLARRRGS
jgi:hypothetical protein